MSIPEKVANLITKSMTASGGWVELFTGNEGQDNEFYVIAPRGLASEVVSIDDEFVLAGAILYGKNAEDGSVNQQIIASFLKSDLEKDDWENRIIWKRSNPLGKG